MFGVSFPSESPCAAAMSASILQESRPGKPQAKCKQKPGALSALFVGPLGRTHSAKLCVPTDDDAENAIGAANWLGVHPPSFFFFSFSVFLCVLGAVRAPERFLFILRPHQFPPEWRADQCSSSATEVDLADTGILL